MSLTGMVKFKGPSETNMKPESMAVGLSLVQGSANEDWVIVWFFATLQGRESKRREHQASQSNIGDRGYVQREDEVVAGDGVDAGRVVVEAAVADEDGEVGGEGADDGEEGSGDGGETHFCKSLA